MKKLNTISLVAGFVYLFLTLLLLFHIQDSFLVKNIQSAASFFVIQLVAIIFVLFSLIYALYHEVDLNSIKWIILANGLIVFSVLLNTTIILWNIYKLFQISSY